MVLTVSEIINGVDEFKEVEIKSLNDTVFLRPLSKGEWEQTNSIRQKSLGDYTTNEKAKALSRTQRVANIESKLSFNIEKNNAADFEASVEAIYLSMSNSGYTEKFTKEDIKKFKPNVFDEIYEKVKEISGISDEVVENLEDDVEKFLED